MVTFDCQTCGQTLSKKQAKKHIYSCSGRRFLCIDCKKVFSYEEHLDHTQCLSEKQLYWGKFANGKPGAIQKKQQQEEEKEIEIKWSGWKNTIKAILKKHDNNVSLKTVTTELKSVFKTEEFDLDEREFNKSLDKTLSLNAFNVKDDVISYIPPSKREKVQKKKVVKVEFTPKDERIVYKILKVAKNNKCKKSVLQKGFIETYTNKHPEADEDEVEQIFEAIINNSEHFVSNETHVQIAQDEEEDE